MTDRSAPVPSTGTGRGPGTGATTPWQLAIGCCRTSTAVVLGGNGIHIDGGPGLISDQWLIENTWTFHCGKNGLLVEGRDSNAGLGQLLNSSGNVEWGVLEQNSFGNTYVACNTSVSGLRSFKVRQLAADGAETGAENYSTFIGCWIEGGDPADFANAPNILVVGGNLVAFAIGANGARQRVGLGFSELTFAEATAFCFGSGRLSAPPGSGAGRSIIIGTPIRAAAGASDDLVRPPASRYRETTVTPTRPRGVAAARCDLHR